MSFKFLKPEEEKDIIAAVSDENQSSARYVQMLMSRSYYKYKENK